VCDTLNVAGAEGVGVLTENLKRKAAAAQLSANLGLTEYDASVPDRLVAAADAIDSAQKAADVMSCSVDEELL